MVLLSSVRIYGIEDGVGVDMLFIHMDADDSLVPWQMLCGEFFGDLQRQFRRNFTRAKGLDKVIVLDTVCFAHIALGVQHLPALTAGVAV